MQIIFAHSLFLVLTYRTMCGILYTVKDNTAPHREEDKMKLETAIQRAKDRVTEMGESADIYAVMYRYKVIRDLPEEQREAVYDEIAEYQGFTW